MNRTFEKWATILLLLYNVANTLFIGFSPATTVISLLILILLWTVPSARRFILAFSPMLIFGVAYDFMRIYPNYMANPIDTIGIYTLEGRLFGLSTLEGTIIPSEYFHLHHWAWLDILTGIFYLLWVPLPLAYAMRLYFTHRRTACFRFLCGFLFVNLVGFAGYYIHPAAPPWYVMEHGFDPILGTPGSVAGFARFDELLGIPVFHSIYAKNSNVFAAVPSLHAAYNLIALYYALRNRRDPWWTLAIAICTVGVWFSAVYSGHHYIIDVILGILTTIVSLFIFERILLPLPFFQRAGRCVRRLLE